jgi:hypothetical protein
VNREMGAAARPAFIADGRKSGTPLLLGDVRIVAGHLCLDGTPSHPATCRAAAPVTVAQDGTVSSVDEQKPFTFKTLYDQPHVVPAILEGGAEARLQPDDMAWPIYSGWFVLWMRYRVSLLPS